METGAGGLYDGRRRGKSEFGKEKEMTQDTKCIICGKKLELQLLLDERIFETLNDEVESYLNDLKEFARISHIDSIIPIEDKHD